MAADFPKNVTVKSFAEDKKFGYRRNDCSLDFTLRVDIANQLTDYVLMLKEAVKDVEKEIAKRFP